MEQNIIEITIAQRNFELSKKILIILDLSNSSPLDVEKLSIAMMRSLLSSVRKVGDMQAVKLFIKQIREENISILLT